VGQDSQGGHFNLLKEKIFKSFNKIRVYTKEPGKKKTDRPIILKPDSTVKDVAEKILHGFSHRIKESRVTGPSGKFPNQKVGLQHKLKDLDTVEFKTN
jgi:ribosome-interacting GTPase 1